LALLFNPRAFFGFRPVSVREGTEWNGRARPYLIPSSAGTDYFIGDPVDLAGASNTTEITHIGGSFAPGALPTITLATLADGNYTIGPIVGFMPTTRDSTIYREASTNRVALVADDPDLIFQIRDDGATALGVASVSLNAIMQSGSGSTVTGLSGYVLDTNGTAPSADASNMLLIERVANIPNNDGTLASTVWEVFISMHRYARLNGILGVTP
jgi:hypothetical protein